MISIFLILVAWFNFLIPRAQVWNFPWRKGGIPFAFILKKLSKMGLLSVMVEGGPITAGRALRERAVDKLLFFYGPKILGGDGRTMIEALGIKKLNQATGINFLIPRAEVHGELF